MNSSEQQAVSLEFDASCAINKSIGSTPPSSRVRVTLDDSSLGLIFPAQEARYISLRDILGLNASNYVVSLDLSSSEQLVISQLGRNFENFQRELAHSVSELTLSDLLMEEPLKMGGLHAFYHQRHEAGADKRSGNCEMRLYQTALVIIPELDLPTRLPYSQIVSAIRDNYRLIVTHEDGSSFVLEQMGRDLDPLRDTLLELKQTISLDVQALIKQMMPSADLKSLGLLSGLLKEGRAARRVDIESVGVELWQELEMRLENSEAGDAYRFLKDLGQKQEVCLGIKRGLMSEEGYYLWFMVPVFSDDTSKPGNVVFMEAVSTEGQSRATYAFRMVRRGDYAKIKTMSELKEQMNQFVQTINRSLISINFRREPIYLTKEMLAFPRYQKYFYSIARLPELRSLRDLYIGRIIHSSSEQWQEDVKGLIEFNMSTQDDAARWNKEDNIEIEQNEAGSG